MSKVRALNSSDPTDTLPASQAAYKFYVKFLLAQHRLRVDESCSALNPVCKLALRKRMTPRQCVSIVLRQAELADGETCDVCRLLVNSLEWLRRWA